MVNLKLEKTEDIGKEIEEVKKRLQSYYIMRASLDKDGSTNSELEVRKKNLEKLEIQDLKLLTELVEKVNNLSEKTGILVDASTGKISNINPTQLDDSDIQKLDKTKEELDTLTREYTSVSTALNGDVDSNVEKQKETDKENIENAGNAQDETKKNRQGIRENIALEVAKLGKRDVLAKKVLEARVKLENAKNEMDLDAAKHVVRKNRMILQLEQVKLELARKIARGAKMSDLSVQACQIEINGIANCIAKEDKEFADRRSVYMTEFEYCKAELEASQKESMLEMENAKDNKNKYARYLTYSEDGILNGSNTKMTRDGRTANEEEIFDERGVMIFDVADIVNRTKTINIDGTVVKCTTEFENHDIEDAYYVGQSEKLVVGSEGNDILIEDKPDIEKEVHDTESGKPAEIKEFMQKDYKSFYEINGTIYGTGDLSKVPEEMKQSVGRAMVILGYDMATGQVSPEGLDVMRKEIVDKAKVMEQNLENEFDEIPFDDKKDEEE